MKTHVVRFITATLVVQSPHNSHVLSILFSLEIRTAEMFPPYQSYFYRLTLRPVLSCLSIL